jgi:hypothetical protein
MSNIQNMMNWRGLWHRLKEGLHQSEPLYRLAMMSNQMGALNHCVSYRIAYPEKKDYEPEIKISLADLLAQIWMFASNEGLSMKEIEEIGQARLEEFIETRLPR